MYQDELLKPAVSPTIFALNLCNLCNLWAALALSLRTSTSYFLRISFHFAPDPQQVATHDGADGINRVFALE